jgi:hypothetical protein
MPEEGSSEFLEIPDYFRLVQPHNFRSEALSAGISVYYLALYPEEAQPTGYVNISSASGRWDP